MTDLTWEHELAAGTHEVHVINRLRMKRAWEAILPPMDIPGNIGMRNSIITALEIDRWAFRESVSVSEILVRLFRLFIVRYIVNYNSLLVSGLTFTT